MAKPYEEAGLKIVNHDYPDEAVDSTRLEIGYLLKGADMRITSEHSPLSFLSQRLAYASRNRIRAINLSRMCRSGRRASGEAERAQPDIFHYAPAEGDETLLRLLERENARAGEDGTLTTRNILVTNGATQGLSLLLGLLDPRRPTILCQSPAFIGITALMQARGYIVRHCPSAPTRSTG